MRNLHTLIVGRTGSGKTTLARALIELTARAVIFDRKHEYNVPKGQIVESLPDAVAALFKAQGGFLRLVFRPRDPDDYMALLQVVMDYQEENAGLFGPIVVVMEEASAYSETHSIHPTIRTAYNQGRHISLSLMTVIQIDTDIHRVTRGNSEVIVSMAQNRMSADMQRYFRWEEIANLQTLRERYVFPPKQGTHFITYPPEMDLYMEWWTTHGYIIEVSESCVTETD